MRLSFVNSHFLPRPLLTSQLLILPIFVHVALPLSKSESVKFSLIESVTCLFTYSSVKKYISLLNQLIFTDSSVNKYFSLPNQSIFTEIISKIWLIYSNLFLATWISQISLIISRFLLIQIQRAEKDLVVCKKSKSLVCLN